MPRRGEANPESEQRSRAEMETALSRRVDPACLARASARLRAVDMAEVALRIDPVADHLLERAHVGKR